MQLQAGQTVSFTRRWLEPSETSCRLQVLTEHTEQTPIKLTSSFLWQAWEGFLPFACAGHKASILPGFQNFAENSLEWVKEERNFTCSIYWLAFQDCECSSSSVDVWTGPGDLAVLLWAQASLLQCALINSHCVACSFPITRSSTRASLCGELGSSFEIICSQRFEMVF